MRILLIISLMGMVNAYGQSKYEGNPIGGRGIVVTYTQHHTYIGYLEGITNNYILLRTDTLGNDSLMISGDTKLMLIEMIRVMDKHLIKPLNEKTNTLDSIRILSGRRR